MKAKILSTIIQRMTDVELYAFVSATILEMRRRSGADTNSILTAISNLIAEMEILKNEQHKNR